MNNFFMRFHYENFSSRSWIQRCSKGTSMTDSGSRYNGHWWKRTLLGCAPRAAGERSRTRRSTFCYFSATRSTALRRWRLTHRPHIPRQLREGGQPASLQWPSGHQADGGGQTTGHAGVSVNENGKSMMFSQRQLTLFQWLPKLDPDFCQWLCSSAPCILVPAKSDPGIIILIASESQESH